MKKFFTSVLACALLSISGTPVSAQQSIGKAEQDMITKEVLPAVFEQIKEHAGIDILGWAHPEISASSIYGIPGLESSNLLRSASQTITAKPDSILLPMPSSLKPLGDQVKLTFSDYEKITLPTGAVPVELNLPKQIKITTPRIALATIYFTPTVEEGNILPFTLKAAMSIDFTLLRYESFYTPKMDLVTVSIKQSETGSIDANVIIETGLKVLLKEFTDETSFPDGFLLSMDLTGMVNSQLPCSLYTISGEQKIPMGEAVLGLNIGKEFPISYVDVKEYEEGKATENHKMWMEVIDLDTRSVVQLDVHKYKFNNLEKTDSTYERSTTIRATSHLGNFTTLKSTKDVARGLVTRVANQMLANQTIPVGELSIWQYDKNSLKTVVTPVFDADVTMSMDESGVVALIDMQTYDEGEPDPESEQVKISFTGALKDQVKVEFIEDNETKATAYLTSNILGVTSSEKIAAPDWTIVPTQEGIRVQNIEKASYQIISMTGSTISAGTISGDAVIPVSSLAKGKYIFVVKANGKQQAVKFIH